jgi:Negative regulator of beta-lactamase expression
MRKISKLIVHCTATREGRDVTVDEIRQWHLKRGWSDIGYHYVIYRDGTVHQGRPIETPGAHTKGHNQHSIGVCYVGGIGPDGHPRDTRTVEQEEALENLLTDLKEQFPRATIHGHREFSAKACPCFDAHEEYKHIGKEFGRKSPAQSTTVQASAVAIASGAGTAVSTISGLDAHAQYIVLIFAGLIVLAGVWIMRERLKRWAAGDR